MSCGGDACIVALVLRKVAVKDIYGKHAFLFQKAFIGIFYVTNMSLT
jgi:hypothetical protein